MLYREAAVSVQPSVSELDAGSLSQRSIEAPAHDRLMADAAQQSVLHRNQQLAALTSCGIGFISTSRSLDTDEKTPISRLLVRILASVAEFEEAMIREYTLSGINAFQAAGEAVDNREAATP